MAEKYDRIYKDEFVIRPNFNNMKKYSHYFASKNMKII